MVAELYDQHLRWLITPSDAAVYRHFGILPVCDATGGAQAVIIGPWTARYRCLGTGMYALELNAAATPAAAHDSWPSLPATLYSALRAAQGAQRLDIGGDLL